ncbi:MAG: AbrB/MazE/SpoVT family DNA-binding domain-containing protein [Proteobacteria bacterium]|nr:AbrB/MazE/SpoVT family DNA-binding domain-containing protein [Pseudomonadota bacterium]
MSVKVSPKFQVVIPEAVRVAIGITPGSRMEVIAKGKVAYLVPVPDGAELQAALAGKLDLIKVRDKKDRKL